MKLTVVTAAPPGVYVAFAAALYFWHVAASLLGVVAADRLGVSDSGFDLRSDLKKMGLCSLIALALFFSLFYFAQSPVVLMVYILCFLLSLKVAYLGESHGFLLIVLGAALAGMIAFVPIVRWLRLPGMFLLYLALAIAFLVLRQIKKQGARKTRENEQLKERRIRSQARLDPNFATFCYQCLFFRPDSARCQLKIDGEDVREIAIDQRTYCTSFRPSQNPAQSGS